MKKQNFLFLHPCPPNRKWALLSRYENVGLLHGIGIFAQMAMDKGHDIKVLVYSDLKRLNKTIKTKHFDWVFVATYTNQNSLILESLKLLAGQLSGAPVVLGGVHATFSPESFEDFPYHLLVRGEGETFFREFLNDGDYLSLPGVFKKGESIKPEFVPLVQDLNTLPFAYRYLKSSDCGYRLDVLAQRGCSYSCTYCANYSYKKAYSTYQRYRTPENVISEILHAMRERYYRHLLFLDENFFWSREWMDEFFALYREKVKMRFSIRIRPAFVKEELLHILKDTGCMNLKMGIECGDAHIRKTLLNRHETDEQIVNAFKLAKKCGFKTYSFNMLGLPADTEEGILNLVDLNRRSSPDVISYTLFHPYPGTKLFEYCYERSIHYPLEESCIRWNIKDARRLPDLPNISRERLAFYLNNFEKLARAKR